MFCDTSSGHGSLPQYGFGPEIEFNRLVDRNPFLFRVHTPKPSSSQLEAPFTALKFDPRYTTDAGSPASFPPPATYAEVGRYMDWTTRYASVYISTSFSFMWAIWEALKRYHVGVKHDIEIAVIDATAIASWCTTAVEVLRSVPPAERHPDHWKWYHFAQESQCVLVYGTIPRSAIIASIPILEVINALPSYCLSHRTPLPSAPVNRVSWTYATGNRKQNYHRFCVAQSALYRALSPETRYADATTGSVRLARVLLDGWVEWMIQLPPPSYCADDPNMFSDAATTKLAELATAVARWPWLAFEATALEEEEAWDWVGVVHEISRLVGEEVKMLQQLHLEQRDGLHTIEEETASLLDADDSDDADTVVDAHEGDEIDKVEYLSPKMSTPPPTRLSLLDDVLPTPPPTPPPSLESRRLTSPVRRMELENPASILAILSPQLRDIDAALEQHAEGTESDLHHVDEILPIASGSGVPDGELPSVDVPATDARPAQNSPIQPDPHSQPEVLEPTEPATEPTLPNLPPLSLSRDAPAAHHPTSTPRKHPHLLYFSSFSAGSRSETASCILTGFLFGALIVVVLSAQRRPALLYCT